MNTQANLALRGAFFGSLLVCFLCCILTAGNTSSNTPTKARAAAAEKPARQKIIQTNHAASAVNILKIFYNGVS